MPAAALFKAFTESRLYPHMGAAYVSTVTARAASFVYEEEEDGVC